MWKAWCNDWQLLEVEQEQKVHSRSAMRAKAVKDKVGFHGENGSRRAAPLPESRSGCHRASLQVERLQSFPSWIDQRRSMSASLAPECNEVKEYVYAPWQ